MQARPYTGPSEDMDADMDGHASCPAGYSLEELLDELQVESCMDGMSCI